MKNTAWTKVCAVFLCSLLVNFFRVKNKTEQHTKHPLTMCERIKKNYYPQRGKVRAFLATV